MLLHEGPTPRAEHARPDWRRSTWLNLNGTWSFCFDPDDKGKCDHWYLKTPDTFDRKITVPFSWASPLSEIGENIKGIGWYSRKVNWSSKSSQDRIFLILGAVDYLCDIWINGSHILTHYGGYNPIELDITANWKTDEDNLITIRAEDNDELYQTRGKQGYGEIRGIWQTVWLESRAENYIDYAHFTTKMDGCIEVSGKIYSNFKGKSNLRFVFDEFNFHEIEIDHDEGFIPYKASFTVPAPKLWSPDNPYLYEGYIELEDAVNNIRDQVFTYFGIREVGTAIYGDRRSRWITLNGKPIFLNGALDQSFHPQGFFTYPSDNEMHAEIWRLKRLGLNFVRIHIKPEEPRKLYWADRLGILVMEDMPCFWGNPDEKARIHYEKQAQNIIKRDFNHPSIISWVMFNETWGLITKDDNTSRIYLPETQEWVRKVYHWAKTLDSTRLIEDNSPCLYDHVESDLNTWHFYLNGYENVQEHISHVAKNTYPGSTFNYTNGNTQSDAPLFNSECGAVWGIDGSAGDSDIAWHYHYMINEFRLHDNICGFIFTEFHDVVNEFNGYYRIDGKDKDFGYSWFNPEMSLKDLHSPDFIVIDAPPCQNISTGGKVKIPLKISSFSEQYHNQNMRLSWELWYDNLGYRTAIGSDIIQVTWNNFGLTALCEITLTMPNFDAMTILAVRLIDSENNTIMRNFVTFDVQSGHKTGLYDIKGHIISIPPASYTLKDWEYTWSALGNHKINGSNSGFFEYNIELPEDVKTDCIENMEVIFEAGAKVLLSKDKEMIANDNRDLSYMLGAKADPGENVNSYFMTDENKHPSRIEIFIDNDQVESLELPDDPADSRGVLSWHYQMSDRRLDEAGSYGYLYRTAVPSRLIPSIVERGSFKLKFKVPENLPENTGGLSLYGRNAGRYPIDILVRCW